MQYLEVSGAVRHIYIRRSVAKGLRVTRPVVSNIILDTWLLQQCSHFVPIKGKGHPRTGHKGPEGGAGV